MEDLHRLLGIFPLPPMSDGDSSGVTAIVAILAILLIAGVGYFFFMRNGAVQPDGPSINVELPAGTTGGGQ